MRTKSDEKRQAILDTANRIFRDVGFEKTSMSGIAAQLGGSKATLYNYFSSKEELFVECMLDMVEDYLEEAFRRTLDNPNTDVATALHDLGRNILHLIVTPDMVASRRLIITEAARSGIGKVFDDKVNARQAQIAAFLERAMNAGTLRRADPLLATRQLRALLETETLEPSLLCVRTTTPSDAELEVFSQRAVDTFLRAYAPEK